MYYTEEPTRCEHPASFFHMLCRGNSSLVRKPEEWPDICKENQEGVVSVLETKRRGASLVAQWLRICLPMQGTWVRALVWEDPTCRRATRPVSHNYRACTSGACAPQQERPQ